MGAWERINLLKQTWWTDSQVSPSNCLMWEFICSSLQVRWSSTRDKSLPDTPTAVLLHGILGSRKNWGRQLSSHLPLCTNDFLASFFSWYVCFVKDSDSFTMVFVSVLYQEVDNGCWVVYTSLKIRCIIFYWCIKNGLIALQSDCMAWCYGDNHHNLFITKK